MCGICGIVPYKYFDGIKIIKAMCSRITHRGPDFQQWSQIGEAFLGHTRLSIQDLSSDGNQPMSDSSGQLHIVFNGEIYNFKKLRTSLENEGVKFRSKTDTEVILYLYRKYGTDCVTKLRGMFSFAIWDSKSKRLFFCRDRLGKKPFIYTIFNGTFWFASEINALVRSIPHKPEFNDLAIDSFLRKQYIPSPMTIYEDILKLPAAHWGIWQDGKITLHKYWKVPFGEKSIKNYKEQEVIDSLENKILECIQLRLVADVPVGCLLSGGIDSSLITAMAAKQLNKPLQTFSIGFKEHDFNELPYANIVASRYKTDHHTFILSSNQAADYLEKAVASYGEPFGDKSALPSLMVSSIASKYVKVVLNGDGGDELMGGYGKYRTLSHLSLFHCFTPMLFALGQKLEKARKLFSEKSLSDRYLQKMIYWAVDPLGHVLRNESFIRARDIPSLYTAEFYDKIYQKSSEQDRNLLCGFNSNIPILHQLISLDYNNYFTNDLLTKMDIASMAYGLETRSPLIDHELIEFASSIPPYLKMRNTQTKKILKRIAERYIPSEVIYRPKKGFSIPVSQWVSTIFREKINEILYDKNNPVWNYIVPNFVERWFDSHLKNKFDHGYRLWVIMILGMWFTAQQKESGSFYD